MFYLTKKSKIMIPILLMKNNESILLFCFVEYIFHLSIKLAGPVQFISFQVGPGQIL